MLDFRYIVVGAGFAGSVLAERIASQLNEKVLLIDRKKHIGGHCFDHLDSNGIIRHVYGPHLFHTNSKKVWDYLSNFTDWDYYQHRVLAFVDGSLIPIPFNFNSLYNIFPRYQAEKIEKKLLEYYPLNSKIPILDLLNNRDETIRSFSEYVYSKIFKNYTAKQWNIDPLKLDPSVIARVPVFIGYDDRYFQDIYQAVPKNGYAKLFENLLSHKNIKLLLGTDFKEIASITEEGVLIGNKIFSGIIIYTGSVDELFEFKFGYLPYRSLKLVFKTIEKEFYQAAATINYPNNYSYTRITEFKYIHYTSSKNTTILFEYPDEYRIEKNDPYYPILTEDNVKLYNKYINIIKEINNIFIIGRLAEYKYYNMDEVVLKALELFEKGFKNEK